MQKYVIYTDGACSGNPGPGGWGAVIISDSKVIKELSGHDQDTTNNRMELLAAIKGLQSLQSGNRVEIFTDSNYVKNGITSWIINWKKNNWVNSAKKPVKNKDLWLELDSISKEMDITWRWVKGHSGDIMNEKADQLAKDAMLAI